MEIINDINRFDSLGGRESVFGLIHIFEGELKRLHETELTEEEIELNYPFGKWRGLECYGNIICPRLLYKAIDVCIEKHKFIKEEFIQIMKWFKGRGSIDLITIYCLTNDYLSKKKSYEKIYFNTYRSYILNLV